MFPISHLYLIFFNTTIILFRDKVVVSNFVLNWQGTVLLSDRCWMAYVMQIETAHIILREVLPPMSHGL